jgi:hypothetical protein
MITPQGIKELLNRRPFRPLRLFLSDGSKHDVPHPEFAWVFGGRVFIGIPGKGTPFFDGAVREIAILHVTRVEELTRGKSRKAGK